MEIFYDSKFRNQNKMGELVKNLSHLFFDVLIFLLEQAELKVNVQVITDRIYVVVQCNSGYDTSLS